MKKVLFFLTLILGVSLYIGKPELPSLAGRGESQKLPENIPFKEVKKTPEIVKLESVLPMAKTKEEFQEKYQTLDLEELEAEAKKLEKIQQQNRYFERANEEDLDNQLIVEITEFLREEAVVRHLILERKLEEFEREYL